MEDNKLTEAEQVELHGLIDELVAKGGPTMGQIKKCGEKSPEKVARLIELGWVVPTPGGNENEAPILESESSEGPTTDITAVHVRREVCSDDCEFADGEVCTRPDGSMCDVIENSEPPIFVHIENRLKKRNTFLADSVRNDRDTAFLNAEIGQRKYKGKIVSITTKKYCEVSSEGDWVTTFDIELKE